LRGILARLVAPREHGQVLILFAVTIPVLLGMTGMAVDLGAYAADRRDLQNASDAAALAAARELPDAGAAEAAAHAWGLKNGIAVADMDVAVSGGTSAPRVRVVIEEPHEFYFMKIVGLDESDVSGAAAAIKASFGGVAPVSFRGH
jgi:Flp pilus assembly protein TadG